MGCGFKPRPSVVGASVGAGSFFFFFFFFRSAAVVDARQQARLAGETFGLAVVTSKFRASG